MLVIVLVGALLLSACAPATPVPAVEKADRGKRTLKVWSYTNEFMAMAVAFEGQNPDVDVEYTMISMTAGEYQTKRLASMGTADAPDVVALEAAFAREYVESDFSADMSSLLPKLFKLIHL